MSETDRLNELAERENATLKTDDSEERVEATGETSGESVEDSSNESTDNVEEDSNDDSNDDESNDDESNDDESNDDESNDDDSSEVETTVDKSTQKPGKFVQFYRANQGVIRGTTVVVLGSLILGAVAAGVRHLRN